MLYERLNRDRRSVRLLSELVPYLAVVALTRFRIFVRWPLFFLLFSYVVVDLSDACLAENIYGISVS